MIGSLSKPLQNDYDTVIIDFLTRYGIENKPVQKFVQAIASTTRSIRRFPRMLLPTKPNSTGKQDTETKQADKDSKTGFFGKAAGKVDGFLTKLDNIENTFNKKGLLGVFLEHYKNKQEGGEAKLAETTSNKGIKEKISLDSNLKQKTSSNENSLISRFLTKLDTTLDTIGKKGPLSLIRGAFKSLKPKTDTTITQDNNTTQIANTSNNITNRISNVENKGLLPKAKGTEQEALMTDTEGQQAQKQNVFRKFTVVLGGIDDQGKKDLKGIFEIVFKEQLEKQQTLSKKTVDPLGEDQGAGTEDEGLLSLAMDLATMRALTKGNKAQAPKPPKKPGFFKRLFGGGAKGGGKGRGLGRLLKMGAGLLAGGAAAATVVPKVLPGPPAGAPPLPNNIPAKPGTPPPPPTSTPAVKPPAAPTAPPKAGGGMMSKVLGTGGSILSKLLTPVIATIEGVQNVGTSVDVLSKEENKDLSTGQKVAAGTLAASGGAADIVTSIFDPTTWGIDKAFGVDWFGEGVSREFLNMIGAKEKGKSMGETLRDRSTGLGKQSNEIAKQKAIEESKKEFEDQKKRLNEKNIGLQALNMKASNLGYKDLNDFARAYASGKEKRRIEWDDESQSVIIINPDNTEEAHKFIPGKGFQGKPENIAPKTDNKSPLTTVKPKTTDNPKQSSAVISNAITNQTSGSTFTNNNTTANSTFSLTPSPETKPITPFSFDLTQSEPTSVSSTSPSFDKPISLTPDTTTIGSSVPQSINETHITNNSADKEVLTDIAGNTEKTNQSLNTLSQAVFALAKVFDAKTVPGGNSVYINGGRSGGKEYTSTSNLAASNNDSIRSIRRQFLAAIG